MTSLALGRLNGRDAGTLAERVAGSEALPAVLVEEIVERTDGVPLFVEELTKALLEAARVTGRRTSVRFRAYPPVTARRSRFPARLADGAPGPARPCGQGDRPNRRGYRAGVLLRTAGRGGAAKRGRIAGLAGPARQDGADLQRGAPPQSAYAFKHALVQDAAYGTLLRDRRRQLHARVAAALEEHFPDAIALSRTSPPTTARRRACQRRRSAYHHEAGRQAVARSAMQEAIGQLRRGLWPCSRGSRPAPGATAWSSGCR